MILAKFYENFLLKCKILVSQAQRTVFFFFFFLLIACSKFEPKSIHQIPRFQLQKYKILQLLRGHIPLRPPPCARKRAVLLMHYQIIPKMSKMGLHPCLDDQWTSITSTFVSFIYRS